jgi:hypothetical protein
LLKRLDKAGIRPTEGFPAQLGRRQVRVVEILGPDALIQPVDDPRSWEIASAGLITVDTRDVEAYTEPKPSDGPQAKLDVLL